MSIFKKLTKLVENVAIDTPIAMVKDVVTFGGICTDKHEPYTVTLLKKIQDEQEKL
jgi:hypothetical protein